MKIGLGFDGDLQQLAQSYPECTCYHRVNYILEVQLLLA